MSFKLMSKRESLAIQALHNLHRKRTLYEIRLLEAKVLVDLYKRFLKKLDMSNEKHARFAAVIAQRKARAVRRQRNIRIYLKWLNRRIDVIEGKAK